MDSRRRRGTGFIAVIIMLLLTTGCQRTKTGSAKEHVSTIDDQLQEHVDTTLRSMLTTVNAESGQVIVMEVNTGEIKAMVNLNRIKDDSYEQTCDFAERHETGLLRLPVMLATLETGRIKMTDTVDTAGGIVIVDGNEIRDPNWHRGGYGSMTYRQGVVYASNIAMCRALERAYVVNSKKFFVKMEEMGVGLPDSIEGIVGLQPNEYTSPNDSDWQNSQMFVHAIGYERQIAPIQVLTFYNAVANGGKMVKPMLHKGPTVVLKEQVASKENVKEALATMKFAVDSGLSHKAQPEIPLKVAGLTGTAQLYFSEDPTKTLYGLNFCGYFPAEDPRYSIIVCIYKRGLPASGGGMCGPIYNSIVKYIYQRHPDEFTKSVH